MVASKHKYKGRLTLSIACSNIERRAYLAAPADAANEDLAEHVWHRRQSPAGRRLPQVARRRSTATLTGRLPRITRRPRSGRLRSSAHTFRCLRSALILKERGLRRRRHGRILLTLPEWRRLRSGVGVLLGWAALGRTPEHSAVGAHLAHHCAVEGTHLQQHNESILKKDNYIR